MFIYKSSFLIKNVEEVKPFELIRNLMFMKAKDKLC